MVAFPRLQCGIEPALANWQIEKYLHIRSLFKHIYSQCMVYFAISFLFLPRNQAKPPQQTNAALLLASKANEHLYLYLLAGALNAWPHTNNHTFLKKYRSVL